MAWQFYLIQIQEEKYMWKILLAIMIFITLVNFSFAQVEQGDSEINFLGYYATMVGTEYSSGGTGSIQLNYGHFVTSNLQLGIGPQITFYNAGGKTKTNFSASAFFNLNFSTSSKTIPYITGQWYQSDFDPESGGFTDASFINVGLGLRNFFNEYLALNNSVTYGFSLAENAEGGLLLIMTGLSFIF